MNNKYWMMANYLFLVENNDGQCKLDNWYSLSPGQWKISDYSVFYSDKMII